MDLHSLARGYLQAGGYQVRRDTDGFLDLEHPEPSGGPPRRLLVWSADGTLSKSAALTALERAERDKREEVLLAAFAKEIGAAPGALGYYLVPSTGGLSRPFSTGASARLKEPGGVRVPVQFFDTGYKVETAAGTKVRSVLGKVLDTAGKLRRVAQPFLIRKGLGQDDAAPAKGDLVEHLDAAMRDPGQGAKVRFIDGAAGSGKTVAFNALLDLTFKEFKEAKASHIRSRRPIAFLPEHIREEAIGYVDDVLDAASDADMAQAVEPEQLRWLLKHGYATWMFDGLDEFYSGDNDFFEFLDKEISDPASQAQFIICARDSLLTSNEAMRGFIERQLRRGGAVELYELAPWDAKCWAQLAWLELENGRKGYEQSSKVKQFVSALQASPTLADLARLPFYCTVMLETFRAQKGMPKDEFQLLQSVVDRMVEREHGKDIFRWQDFVDIDALSESIEEVAADQHVKAPHTADTRAILADVLDSHGRAALFELIEALAHEHRRNPGAGTGSLGVDELRNFYGRTYASATLDDPDVNRLLTVLAQFAFFGAGRSAGSVDFTHHILADYLAGRYALRLLRSAASEQAAAAEARRPPSLSDARRPIDAFRQAIGTAAFAPAGLFARYIAQQIKADAKLAAFVRSLQGVDLGRDNVTAAYRALAA